MAHIKHYFREEAVWEECCDRGVDFFATVRKNVEHFVCSKCGKEVKRSSRFCEHCGEKLTSVKDMKETHKCIICDAQFGKYATDAEDCCRRCRGLISNKHGSDLAKVFYELGSKSTKGV